MTVKGPPGRGVLERMLAIVLLVIAAGMVGLVTIKRFRAPAATTRVPRQSSIAPDPRLTAGPRLGRVNSARTVVVFTDYQCPFCRRLDRFLQAARKGTDLAVVVRHFPLEDIHPNALRAALAAECAADQGRFAAIHARLFDVADSLSLAVARRLAATAGVPDLARFDRCVAEQLPLSRINRDRAAARRLGVVATPTWVVGTTLIEGVGDATHVARVLSASRSPAR